MSKTLKKSKIKTILKEFFEFDESVKNNYKDLNKNDQGYLINKKYIDDIKEKLFYESFKKYSPDSEEYNKLFKEKFKEKITFDGCEQQIFKTSENLKKALDENNEYILVNYTIWSDK